MSTSKKVLQFGLPWTDPSQVGDYMYAPGQAWDGGPWVESPPILAFAPDSEAAAQYVNFLHKRHDYSAINLNADSVHKDFSLAAAKTAIATGQTMWAEWAAAENAWMICGAASGNKKLYSLNRHSNALVDITPTFAGGAQAGTAGCVAAPYGPNETLATLPNGGGSRLLALAATNGTGTPECWRIDLASGSTSLATITTPATGSGSFAGMRTMIIGGKGLTTPTIAWFGARADDSFHIFESICNFGVPTTSTTSYPASTVSQTSRFKPLRAPYSDVGDTDCIFELAEFNTGNKHKVFCRRFGSGPASWVKYNEPFATIMDTAGGVQARVIGATFDPRLQSIVVAIHRYDGATPGIYFCTFDPQNGVVTALSSPFAVYTQFHINALKSENRGILTVVSAGATIFPVAFAYYNDAWLMLLGGVGASVMPVWSYDFGNTWHGDASALVAGATSFNPTPGGPGALFVYGPDIFVGDRGFFYAPNMVAAVTSGGGIGVVSPFGGAITGPMT